MTSDRIKAIQTKLGFTGNDVDGFWGPESIQRVQKHLRSLMPAPNPWPFSDETSLRSFYGAAGDESVLVNIKAPKGLLYEGAQAKTVCCHAKVADSLSRILPVLCKDFPVIAAQYAGCFNNRNMRGGSRPSLHARGAAVDFAPATNGNHTHWPSKADMPFEVMELFAREGWLPAGAFWGRDAMHFQATR